MKNIPIWELQTEGRLICDLVPACFNPIWLWLYVLDVGTLSMRAFFPEVDQKMSNFGSRISLSCDRGVTERVQLSLRSVNFVCEKIGSRFVANVWSFVKRCTKSRKVKQNLKNKYKNYFLLDARAFFDVYGATYLRNLEVPSSVEKYL